MTPAPSQSSADTPANLSLFERLYTVLLPWIITHARRLSNSDRDLQDDLMQTGLQTLWEQCTPAVTTLDPDDIRADLYRAMIEYKRAERRASIIAPEWIRERDNADCTIDNIVCPPVNQTIRVAAPPVATSPSSADMTTSHGPVLTSRAIRATSRA
ncbi:MAG TPA: hypothetical protein VNU46_00045, partial [Gemmatimonadaceae bacterium]|nr:hypothetical protein [Gemmatimonadaceae bacterium]